MKVTYFLRVFSNWVHHLYVLCNFINACKNQQCVYLYMFGFNLLMFRWLNSKKNISLFFGWRKTSSDIEIYQLLVPPQYFIILCNKFEYDEQYFKFFFFVLQAHNYLIYNMRFVYIFTLYYKSFEKFV